jgi:hypothetical protein
LGRNPAEHGRPKRELNLNLQELQTVNKLTENKTAMLGVAAIILSMLVPVLVPSVITGHPLSRTAIAAGA